MSDYHIALPSKPRAVSETEHSGTYEINGLYPGYGYTLGNSLRRIILSSLPGAAITHVKIPNISHEFSTIEGVKEDAVTMLLNIRRIRLKILTDEPQTITLSVKGPHSVTAADFKVPGQAEILNPEQHIANITGKVSLELELRAERGLGYVPKEAHQKERVDIGTIALDAIFSPIRRVNYEVENMRVVDRDAEVLKTRITELSLPQRVEDALDNASIRTVGGLVRKREDDLLSIEGLGQKGLQDIKRALSNLGLTLRQ